MTAITLKIQYFPGNFSNDPQINNAQFIGVCSSVETCSKEEGRGKGRGEKAYKAIAEEQRAFHSLCEAAYTVNGPQRVQ